MKIQVNGKTFYIVAYVSVGKLDRMVTFCYNKGKIEYWLFANKFIESDYDNGFIEIGERTFYKCCSLDDKFKVRRQLLSWCGFGEKIFVSDSFAGQIARKTFNFLNQEYELC